MDLKLSYLLLLFSVTVLWGNPLFAILPNPSRIDIEKAVKTLNSKKCSNTFDDPQIYFSPYPEKSIGITPDYEIIAKVVNRNKRERRHNKREKRHRYEEKPQVTENIKLPSILAYLRNIPNFLLLL